MKVFITFQKKKKKKKTTLRQNMVPFTIEFFTEGAKVCEWATTAHPLPPPPPPSPDPL